MVFEVGGLWQPVPMKSRKRWPLYNTMLSPGLDGWQDGGWLAGWMAGWLDGWMEVVGITAVT